MRIRLAIVVALIWVWSTTDAHAAFWSLAYQHKTKVCNTVHVIAYREGVVGSGLWSFRPNFRACRRDNHWLRRHIHFWYHQTTGDAWRYKGVKVTFHRTRTYVYWSWRAKFIGFSGLPTWFVDEPHGWVKIGKRRLHIHGKSYCGC